MLFIRRRTRRDLGHLVRRFQDEVRSAGGPTPPPPPPQRQQRSQQRRQRQPQRPPQVSLTPFKPPHTDTATTSFSSCSHPKQFHHHYSTGRSSITTSATQPPGTNFDLDPRGVDYSLFEPPTGEYSTESRPSKERSKRIQDQEDHDANLGGSLADPAGSSTSSPSSTTTTIAMAATTKAPGTFVEMIPRTSANGVRLTTNASSPSSVPEEIPHATVLLCRLIRSKDYRAASQALRELLLLQTPLGPPKQEYLDAAVWSAENDRRGDVLNWLSLSPSIPQLEDLSSSLNSSSSSIQGSESPEEKVKSVFRALLANSPHDLVTLQRACILASSKGYWNVISATLSQILRYGKGGSNLSASTCTTASDRDSSSSPSVAGWELFQALLRAFQSQPCLDRRVTEVRLSHLYNLGVRTLALSGRYQEAIDWASRSRSNRTPRQDFPRPSFSSPQASGGDRSLTTTTTKIREDAVLRLKPFTYNLLLEELFKVGGEFRSKAISLDQELRRSSSQTTPSPSEDRDDQDDDLVVISDLHSQVNLVQVEARIKEEKAWRSGRNEASSKVGGIHSNVVDLGVREALQGGDLLLAREILLNSFRGAERVKDTLGTSGNLSHLPSASTLADLQESVVKFFGSDQNARIEEEGDHGDGENLVMGSSSSSSSSFKITTVAEFFRPLRQSLNRTRGGKGLWETSRILSYVRRGRFESAIEYWKSGSGFRYAGGVTVDLLDFALTGLEREQRTSSSSPSHLSKGKAREVSSPSDTNSSSNPDELQDDQQEELILGKLWPSSHSINLILRALCGICIQSRDYQRLEKVYSKWLSQAFLRSEPSSPSSPPPSGSNLFDQGPDQPWWSFEVDLKSFNYQPWPPSSPPTSHTFDGFLRSFSRLEFHDHQHHHHLRSSIDSTNPSETLDPTSLPPRDRSRIKWGNADRSILILRDMAERGIRPSVSSWTIILESLARQGKDSISRVITLAQAMGMDLDPESKIKSSNGSPPSPPPPPPTDSIDRLPSATVATYTALIRSLIRVPSHLGGPMVGVATLVRDDLISKVVKTKTTPPPEGIDSTTNTTQSTLRDLVFQEQEIFSNIRTVEALNELGELEMEQGQGDPGQIMRREG
ncbi:hypothetical protein IE53DRAFT_386858 [Violaceomyces palustris]|uniref:Uncharacterized protein n=1 Tax=Violaceomyces palustris TaxID=1673888 RepID=A0ACD0NYV1_9BASI|nr:hypothetical protein IE53DRAFT_386858 [Violaceomyces palustris]